MWLRYGEVGCVDYMGKCGYLWIFRACVCVCIYVHVMWRVQLILCDIMLCDMVRCDMIL